MVKKKIKKLNTEFRKATNTAIIAAFGFIMALAWRDVIIEYVEKLTSFGPAQGSLFSALIVTFISVIGIIIVTKFFRVEE